MEIISTFLTKISSKVDIISTPFAVAIILNQICVMAKKSEKEKSAAVPGAKKSKAAAKPMAISQKKEMAKMLFTHNDMSQKEVAERVGITAKTMSNWVSEGLWMDYKKSLSQTKDETLKMMYDQLSELNNGIKKRDEGFRFPSPDEANIQKKLTTAIADLETETNIAHTMQVTKEFTTWMKVEDMQLRKTILHLFDGFIKHRLQKK